MVKIILFLHKKEKSCKLHKKSPPPRAKKRLLFFRLANQCNFVYVTLYSIIPKDCNKHWVGIAQKL